MEQLKLQKYWHDIRGKILPSQSKVIENQREYSQLNKIMS